MLCLVLILLLLIYEGGHSQRDSRFVCSRCDGFSILKDGYSILNNIARAVSDRKQWSTQYLRNDWRQGWYSMIPGEVLRAIREAIDTQSGTIRDMQVEVPNNQRHNQFLILTELETRSTFHTQQSCETYKQKRQLVCSILKKPKTRLIVTAYLIRNINNKHISTHITNVF